MIYQVYVIQNLDDKKYIGITSDVDNRVSQHNSGESNYTKSRGPWKLIWVSRKMSLSDARKLENKMKRQKGGSGLQTLMDAFGS